LALPLLGDDDDGAFGATWGHLPSNGATGRRAV
jgi:hypothetical protein